MYEIKEHLENRNGTLFIGGASVPSLADRFGTPLYVMDEQRIRENYRRLHRAFSSQYGKIRVYYAVKTNNNLAARAKWEACGREFLGQCSRVL